MNSDAAAATDGRFGLTKHVIDQINAVFTAHPLIQDAVIYGSRAKGTYRRGSDIDLTLKAEQMTLTELMKIETELDDLLLPYKIDLSLFHKINDADVIDHINRVGLIFYHRT